MTFFSSHFPKNFSTPPVSITIPKETVALHYRRSPQYVLKLHILLMITKRYSTMIILYSDRITIDYFFVLF